MAYVDTKFVNLLSVQLRNFRKLNETTWKMSCEFCGDSKKNKNKARGHIYTVKNDLFYRCFNCGYSTTFGSLLKHVSPMLYSDYVVERYKMGVNKHKPHKTIDIPDTAPAFSDTLLHNRKVLNGLIPITDSIEAMEYCKNRLIPESKWEQLYYTKQYKKLINALIPNKFEVEFDSPRIVLPYYDKDGFIFQLTGRAIDDNFMRYSNIKLRETEHPVYGIDKVDTSKTIYVVEGPIDSLFIDNCVAVSGSSFNSSSFIKQHKDKVVLVYDNEPRATEITRIMESSIKNNYSVCIWDNKVVGKDINEMVKNGIDAKQMIDQNTFKGAEALLNFIKWRKC